MNENIIDWGLPENKEFLFGTIEENICKSDKEIVDIINEEMDSITDYTNKFTLTMLPKIKEEMNFDSLYEEYFPSNLFRKK